MSSPSWPLSPFAKDTPVQEAAWAIPPSAGKVRKAFVDEVIEEVVFENLEEPVVAEPPPMPEPEPEPEPPAQPEPEPEPKIDEVALLARKLEEELAVLASAIGEVVKATEQGFHDYRSEVLELGLAVAGELAAGAIEADPERVLKIIDEASGLLGRDRHFRVYLHPELYEHMEIAGVLDDIRSNEQISVYSDRKVGDVGCVIESDGGRVDARIQARLNKLKYAVKNEEGSI